MGNKVPCIANELAEYPHLHINDLIEFQDTLKDLTTREYKKLRKSILEHGFYIQFFVWTSPDGIHYILDGHQRKRVIIGEGWLMLYPVQFIAAASYAEAKEKLLTITSQYGKITQEGYDEFTFDMNPNWLQETVMFDALPFVFGDTSPPEEEESKDAEPQTNRADELREVWGVELGQMWRLPSRTEGQEHRLICGDCTDGDVVERVMGGEVAEICFTSPPYADARDYTGDSDLSIKFLSAMFDNDSVNYFVVNLGLLFRNSEVYCYWDEWIREAKDRGLKHLAWNVWDKTLAGSVASATNMFHLTHEWIFVFGGEKKRLNRTVPNQMDKYKRRHGNDVIAAGFTSRNRSQAGDVRSSSSPAYTHHQLHSVVQHTPELGKIRESGHPALFPVGFAEKYVNSMTLISDCVYEPFSGGGTTIIAAENLSRQCRAVEISPAYVAVALQRYQDAFGITPELITG